MAMAPIESERSLGLRTAKRHLRFVHSDAARECGKLCGTVRDYRGLILTDSWSDTL
jgi:hypothetical protein